MGLTEWEVLSTFSCHQLGECDLTATRPDSPGRHLDGAVASGARLAFLGPRHHMPFLEWPLRSALNQPSLPSGPAWGTGQTGLNLASPLTSRGVPQTHLHSSSVKWAHIHPPHRVAVRTTVLLVVPTQHQSVKANTERKEPAQRPTSRVSTFRDIPEHANPESRSVAARVQEGCS